MTEVPVSFIDGPDPHEWERNAELSVAADDVRAADEMLALLRGTRPMPPMSRAYAEALTVLENTAAQARELLAARLLAAHGIVLPEEPADQATEAAGGFRGDSNGEGNRDHL